MFVCAGVVQQGEKGPKNKTKTKKQNLQLLWRIIVSLLLSINWDMMNLRGEYYLEMKNTFSIILT